MIQRGDRSTSPVHIHVEDATPVHVHVKKPKKPRQQMVDVSLSCTFVYSSTTKNRVISFSVSV